MTVPGPDNRPPSPDEMLAAARDEARRNAQAASMAIARDFVPAIELARELLPVEDTELVSASLTRYLGRRSPLPRDVQRRLSDAVLGLHEKLGALIHYTADWIEAQEYWSIEQATQQIKAANLRASAQALVAADRQLSFSARALSVAIEIFTRLNTEIIEQLEARVLPADRERNLLFANAVLVYETTDFAVRYLEQFSTGGVTQLEELYQESMARITAQRVASAEVRERIDKSALDPELKAVHLASCEQDDTALRMSEEVWNEYIGEQRERSSHVTSDVQRLLEDFRLRRDLAYIRIAVLKTTALPGLINESVRQFKAAALSIDNLRVAPLTTSRLHRLLGIEAESADGPSTATQDHAA